MRVRSAWYQAQGKTIDDIASALAFNAWRITKNNLEDLINEAFVIEKAQVFDVIAEYLFFLIQAIDRLSYQQLKSEQRKTLIISLVKRLAAYYQQEKSERIGNGEHQQEFVKLYNQRSVDYGEYEFLNNEPSYHCLRYFGRQIQNAMTKADEKWILQQIVEIQAPKTFVAIKSSMDKLMSGAISDKKATKKPKIKRSQRSSKL